MTMQPPDDPFVRPPSSDVETSGDEIVVVAAEPVLDGDDIEILDDAVAVAVEEPPVVPNAAGASRQPRVDPRIRARRIAVAREQGRRRLRVVLVALSLGVVLGSAWLFVESPIVDVDHIVVVGVPQARVAAVIAASGVHRRDPLLLVSTGAVARRVEQVPGIGSVHVSRDLPGTLRITARQQGVALWARTKSGVALIGHDGRVQRITTAVPGGNSIELRGLARVPSPGNRIANPAVVDVMAQLPTALAIRVGAVSATTSADVRLYLKVGGEIRLGDFSLVHDKGVAAEAVLERMGCAINYVDVRSISNPVALAAPGVTCNQ